MKSSLINLVAGLALAAGLQTAATARAISLYSLDQKSGFAPNAGVITDAHGTIFGTGVAGGNGNCFSGLGCGTVFELLPPNGGGFWTLKVLHDFQDAQDGYLPEALTLGPNGSVFGSSSNDQARRHGTVFQLLPPAKRGERWTFQILYTFTGKNDGELNVGSPLILHHNSLYGIAYGGSYACGQLRCGSVFRLSAPALGSGPWTEKTLYKFSGGATSGLPTSIVGFGPQEALYLSTALGNGAVVELAPANGKWSETVLTTFNGGNDGAGPFSLVLANDGAIYGLASTETSWFAFQLTPPNGNTGWTRTSIATIDHKGYGPNSLSAGLNGTLVGTIWGDVDFFPGAIFQLTPNGSSWTYSEPWNFNRGPDRNPINVVPGRGGNLFGVLNGGDSDGGDVFELR